MANWLLVLNSFSICLKVKFWIWNIQTLSYIHLCVLSTVNIHLIHGIIVLWFGECSLWFNLILMREMHAAFNNNNKYKNNFVKSLRIVNNARTELINDWLTKNRTVSSIQRLKIWAHGWCYMLSVWRTAKQLYVKINIKARMDMLTSQEIFWKHTIVMIYDAFLHLVVVIFWLVSFILLKVPRSDRLLFIYYLFVICSN